MGINWSSLTVVNNKHKHHDGNILCYLDYPTLSLLCILAIGVDEVIRVLGKIGIIVLNWLTQLRVRMLRPQSVSIRSGLRAYLAYEVAHSSQLCRVLQYVFQVTFLLSSLSALMCIHLSWVFPRKLHLVLIYAPALLLIRETWQYNVLNISDEISQANVWEFIIACSWIRIAVLSKWRRKVM